MRPANSQHVVFERQARAAQASLQASHLRDAAFEAQHRGRLRQSLHAVVMNAQQFFGEVE
jgi:hypothetical protein